MKDLEIHLTAKGRDFNNFMCFCQYWGKEEIPAIELL